MPYLSLTASRNRAMLIAALLIMEFLAILWLKDSGPSQTQPHSRHQLHQRQKHGQDVKAQGKKIKDSKMKAASPRFLNGGAGIAPYHIHDEQWDFSMRVVRPERRQLEGGEDRKDSEKKPSSDHDQEDHAGKKDYLDQSSLSVKPPPPPPSQDPSSIDIPAPPTPVKQNQQQQEGPSEELQGQHHYHRANSLEFTPEFAPIISGTGIKNTSDQQKGEGKEKGVSEKEPVKSKGDKDERLEVSSIRAAPASISNKTAKSSSKLSEKERQQSQQRVQEKNQRGRFKSTKERKLAQLMPALDEYGVVIEDHFISPRDSEGDGVPDYYVLLRPSSSIDTAAVNIGLFEDEVAKIPLPPPSPNPLMPPFAQPPNTKGQPGPASLGQLTIVARNAPSQTSEPPSSSASINMPLTPPAPATPPSPSSDLS